MRQLREVAGRLHHLPVEEFCDALLAELAELPSDDIAVLVLRVQPPPSLGAG